MLFLYQGDSLGAYGFGENHPFGPDRLAAFLKEFYLQHLHKNPNIKICPPHRCSKETLAIFHTAQYVKKVISLSESGSGFLDQGDTPAVKGIYDSASTVVGTVVNAIDRIMQGDCQKAFVPIAGLHHARRDTAAGFCVFNDIGVVIERLYDKYKMQRIAYVDIDAHHGDGVYYEFEEDPRLCFVDFHEDGRYLYPGTGAIEEIGLGLARGSKLNIPLPPETTDDKFADLWPRAEKFIRKFEPDLIIFQCGADSLEGDPITHMRLSCASHAMVAARLSKIADEYCGGRLLALGGGGYNRKNLGWAWCAVVSALLTTGN